MATMRGMGTGGTGGLRRNQRPGRDQRRTASQWPRSVVLSALVCVVGLAIGMAGRQAIAGEPAGPAERLIVLDTHSFWRTYFVMREPAYGTSAQDAKPQEPAKKGSGIKYNTSLPAADWAQPDFDDGQWARRPGPFFPGYGFSQPQTVGLLCLRGTFAVADPAKAGPVTFAATYRGGIVVYVNGQEVARKHLPDGKLDMETLAETYPPDAYMTPDEKVIPKGGERNFADRCDLRIRRLDQATIPPTALRKGANVLAIELHRPPIHSIATTLPDYWKGAWNPTGLLSAELSAGGAGVTANLVRPKGLQVWNADLITPVFDVDYGDPNTKAQPIRIIGARNGTFSGQVVVGSDQPIKGLRASVGDFKQGGGAAAIAASAAQVRYSQPGGRAGGAGDRYPGVGGVTMFDTLAEEPPAEVPVFRKETSRGYKGRSPVFGAVQPIWVTVTIPATAAAGEYVGQLTIAADGESSQAVPVHLKVCDWTFPATRDFAMHADLVESPESVALRYNVPLWSEEHFKLVGRSLEMLGQVANKTVYIHLICRSNHGNSQTMVRWVKQADGSFRHDFSIMDKYLDLYIEKVGKPAMVIFYVSDAYTGQGYFGSLTSRVKKTGPAVSTVGPDGQVVEFEGPMYDDQEKAQAFWKPVAEGVRDRLAKRGLANCWHIGLASDRKPHETTVRVWKAVAPEAKWVHQGHASDGAYFGVPVGYNTTVWKPVFAPDPSVDRYYGWAESRRIAYFHRDIHQMEAIAQMLESRLIGEKNIQGKQCGFGRFNADFWPVIKDKTGAVAYTISSRYPESSWAQCNINMTAYLAPGPAGAISTARFENIREGIEECEARIFIEKALLDKAHRARLGEGLAEELQAMLDARTRAIICAGGELGTNWYSGSGWQERSEKLFAGAAAVAKALGGKADEQGSR